MTREIEVTIYRVANEGAASELERRMASSSPAFLRPMLGRAYRRRRILGSHINWQRVLLAAIDGEVVGYLQFYLQGKGPHELQFSHLRDEFGWWQAIFRYAIYRVLHRRFERCEAYLYRIVIVESARGLGVGERLIKEWLGMLRHANVGRADLDVWGNNPRAAQLYQRLGFSIARSYRFPFKVSGLKDTRLIRMVHRW